MRVIAGEAHGRKLKAPGGGATRPTLARVRESIFSRLAARIDLAGKSVLDLFAGAGALGIEALSRGAAHATFVEIGGHAVAAIERNLIELRLADKARVLRGEVMRTLGKLAHQRQSFDLVLMDPPYGSGLAAKALNELAARDLLKPAAWVVVELARAEETPPPGAFDRVSVAVLGDHQIVLYRRPDETPQ